VVIQRGQDRLQAYSPKAKNAIDTIQCISAKNTDCFSNLSYVKDAKGRLMKELPTQKIDPKQYVGQWSRLDPNSPAGKAAALVTQVSKLPKSEMIPMMNNEWVMTWTLGSNGNLEPNKPTVVLTYVGKNKPFQSTARYSRVQPRKAAPVGPRKSAPVAVGNPSATTATRATNFACQVPHGATRRVVVTSTGRSCEAVYLRESRPTTQVIYRTPSNGSICTQKAYEFMADLGRKGVQCRPR
jgi:hypothetical protein